MIQILIYIGVALGTYIMLEAVDDVGHFAGINRLCMVIRDVLTGVVGLALLWCSIMGQVDWLHLGLGAALALYIWPKMIFRVPLWWHRFKRWIDRIRQGARPC